MLGLQGSLALNGVAEGNPRVADALDKLYNPYQYSSHNQAIFGAFAAGATEVVLAYDGGVGAIGGVSDIVVVEKTTHRELNRAGRRESHHVIQDAAVRDLPGYNRNDAPAVQLRGPASDPTTPHGITRPIQRQRGGGTYAAERRIGYKALRRAGLSKQEARAHIYRADEYFRKIGVKPSTPTRIPADRR